MTTDTQLFINNKHGYSLRIDSYIMDLDSDTIAVSTKANVLYGLEVIDFGYLSNSFTADIGQKGIAELQKVQQERLLKLMGDFWGEFHK
ncbi:MAG: hypothetical protein MR853_01865 [Selenomonadales bacterium]|nr:hypothetical protein [Selenomonadales bacterium]